MEELTPRQYATRTKQSMFAVIKKMQYGELRTIKKEVDGKEIELILCENISPAVAYKAQDEAKNQPQNDQIDYEKEFHKLLAKYIELQEKYEKLLLNGN